MRGAHYEWTKHNIRRLQAHGLLMLCQSTTAAIVQGGGRERKKWKDIRALRNRARLLGGAVAVVAQQRKREKRKIIVNWVENYHSQLDNVCRDFFSPRNSGCYKNVAADQRPPKNSLNLISRMVIKASCESNLELDWSTARWWLHSSVAVMDVDKKNYSSSWKWKFPLLFSFLQLCSVLDILQYIRIGRESCRPARAAEASKWNNRIIPKSTVLTLCLSLFSSTTNSTSMVALYTLFYFFEKKMYLSQCMNVARSSTTAWKWFWKKKTKRHWVQLVNSFLWIFSSPLLG